MFLDRGSRLLASLILCVNIFHSTLACFGQTTSSARQQAVLKLNGDFPTGGGFRLTESATSGPGANLELAGAAVRTRGILERGDVITQIAGKPFQTRREFMDLMNEANKAGSGTVMLTVRDVATGREVNWIARPDVVQMQVPNADEGFNFLSQLGPPVAGAPDVPKVPVVVAP